MEAVLLNDPKGHGFEGAFFDKKIYNLGLTFSFPEKEVKGMKMDGTWPLPCMEESYKGTNYGIGRKEYNNTIPLPVKVLII